MHISRLAELDDMKPILVACEGLAPYMGGVLEELACDSELPSHHPAEEPPIRCLRGLQGLRYTAGS